MSTNYIPTRCTRTTLDIYLRGALEKGTLNHNIDEQCNRQHSHNQQGRIHQRTYQQCSAENGTCEDLQQKYVFQR
jgi:hypothetical protein